MSALWRIEKYEAIDELLDTILTIGEATEPEIKALTSFKQRIESLIRKAKNDAKAARHSEESATSKEKRKDLQEARAQLAKLEGFANPSPKQQNERYSVQLCIQSLEFELGDRDDPAPEINRGIDLND